MRGRTLFKRRGFALPVRTAVFGATLSAVAFVLWPGVCVFEAPRGWTWETVEGVVSLFREDGSGAAQVAVVPSPGSAELLMKQELQRFQGGEFAVDHFTERIPRAAIKHGDERWELYVLVDGPRAAT